MSCQSIAIVMPAIGCDLQLSDTTKGAISSMTFTGMLFSGQLFGFLADTFGRKRVVLYSQITTAFLLAGCGLTPDTITMMVMLFLNGFVLTGVLTPAYVYVSEFTATKDRATALVVLTAIGALANVYLPGMAWLLMPLNINLPIVGDMRFTSWRLFIILLTIPILLSTLLLLKLPESPKFLLSQGKPDETLEILQSIYAINKKKRKDSFPVLSVCLDSDDQACNKIVGSGNQYLLYFKMMMRQTFVLFSKEYISYTLLSCGLLFGIVGGFNTVFLWFPVQAHKIVDHSNNVDNYNVTLCDLMASRISIDPVAHCHLDYSFFSYSIILGASQFVTCLMSSFVAKKMGRKHFLSLTTFLTTLLCFGTLFITSEYLTIGSIMSMTLLLYLAFPVSVSVIVEFFPTPLRSTATSIITMVGRLGATIGSQTIGALYENYCEEGYIGMTIILGASFIICLILPVKK
nr:synaptic vesicle glycoprotein 2A-like isoform X2 [Halyomorpha halys]XP_014272120.1 synaptic vesicle glycoprotein 2A-like isoform X2 [Halyomorpha halys]